MMYLLNSMKYISYKNDITYLMILTLYISNQTSDKIKYMKIHFEKSGPTELVIMSTL